MIPKNKADRPSGKLPGRAVFVVRPLVKKRGGYKNLRKTLKNS